MPFNTVSSAPRRRPILSGLFWLTMLVGADVLASSRCILGQGASGGKIFPSNPRVCVLPLVPYHAEEKNISRALLPPSQKHFLGTDDLGRDAAAVVIHGTRRSVFTALLAAGVALIFAVGFGAVAGFFGDDKLNISFSTAVLVVVGALAGGFHDFWWGGAPLFFFIGAAVGAALSWALNRLIKFPAFAFPLDSIFGRTSEIWYAVPAFLALLVSTALFPPSYYTSGLTLGLLQWPPAAWTLRAQTKTVVSQDYIRAAYAAGARERRVFWRHVLPNALPAVRPVLLQVAATSVIAEAAIAFLGLGPEYPSWGGLMAAARKYPDAWWLVVFPGAALFFFVRFLYQIRGTAP